MDSKTYKFGEFQLNPKLRELRYKNETVALNPRAFEILLLLVKKPGEVVEKKEILDTVWADSYVEENTLVVHVSALRKILKEKDDARKYIETITGRGYVFVADVEEIAVANSIADITNLEKFDKRTINEEAYRLYLKGKYVSDLASSQEDRRAGFMQALDWFERAVEKDPDFALAYAWIGNIYCSLFNDNLAGFEEVYHKAKTAMQSALKADDTLTEVYAMLGRFYYTFDKNLAAAEMAFRQAIVLDPQYGRAFHLQSFIYILSGRLDEALELQLRAVRIEPTSLINNFGLGRVYYYRGEYEKSVAQIVETLKLDKRNTLCLYMLALDYAELGRFEDALEQIEKCLDVQFSIEMLTIQAYVLAEMGNRTEAKKIVGELLSGRTDQKVDYSQTAYVYAALRENDRAFEFLEKALEKRDCDIMIVRIDPRYKNLHSDPRFAEFVSRLNF